MQVTASGADATGTSELARDLLAFLVQVHRACGHDVLRLIDGLGLSLTQVKGLHALEEAAGDMSMKDVAAALGVSLPAASRAVEGLHCRGLVDRREHARDRRVKLVRIAPAGRDLVLRLHGARLQGLERFVETLGEADRRALAAGLAPILHGPDPAPPAGEADGS